MFPLIITGEIDSILSPYGYFLNYKNVGIIDYHLTVFYQSIFITSVPSDFFSFSILVPSKSSHVEELDWGSDALDV